MTEQTKSRTGAGIETLARLVVVAVIVAGLYFLNEFFIPLAFAWMLTLLLTPAVERLERIHLNRGVAVFFVLGLSLAVLGYATWTLTNQVLQVANDLPTYRQNIRKKALALQGSKESALSRAAASVKEVSEEIAKASAENVEAPPPASPAAAPSKPVPVEIKPSSTSGLDMLREIGNTVMGPLAVGGLALIFAIFMLMDREDLRCRFLRLSGTTNLLLATRALEDATTRVSRYLLLLLGVNFGFGAIVGVALWLIGLPNPLLWAALAGVLRVVPYVGTLISTGLPVALSFAVFDGWTQPLLVLATFLVLELVTGHVVEPLLYGAHTGISSLALLVAAVFWTVVWGPAGLVLSTPLTVCLVVLGHHVPGFATLHVLLGDGPALLPQELLYQRLLAGDTNEARQILAGVAGEKAALFDEVVMPALRLMERDRHKGSIDPGEEETLYLGLRTLVTDTLQTDCEPSGECPPAPGRIVFFPAKDQGDEVAGVIAAEIFRPLGFETEVLPDGLTQEEMLNAVELNESDVLCVSSVPPHAIAPARSMVRSLARRFPKHRIVVALWGYQGDTQPVLLQLPLKRKPEVVTSIVHFNRLLAAAETSAV